MQNIFAQLISTALNIPVRQVEAVLNLLNDGCTIPFISRYRKEATGGLDEVQIADIDAQHAKLQELADRKETILNTIDEQGKLTDELRQRIEQSWNATELEDIYLPYRPKRRTRAMIAREKGLEPLAMFLLDQAQMPRSNVPLNTQLPNYVNPEKGVSTADEAIAGAQDIIAELVAEDERARGSVRRNFEHDAVIESRVVKGKETDGQKFRDYFDWKEKLSRCPSHRLLAMRRGEAEGVLRVSIGGNDAICMERLNRQFVRNGSQAGMLVADAVADGFKRLLKPSIETEFAQSSKERADAEAIRIFVKNLEQLLMSAPLGQKRVLALDPGFRTGCKVVCLDAEGNLLHHDVIYPHPPKSSFIEAMNTMEALVKKYRIEAISIGNGTASRETEEFVRGLSFVADGSVKVFVVSEDGASIYSASKVARDEFPDLDLTVRGAPAIGVSGAFAVALWGLNEWDGAGIIPFTADLEEIAEHVAAVRPTAVNLAWGVEQIVKRAKRTIDEGGSEQDAIREMLARAQEMADQDEFTCRVIGLNGAQIFGALSEELGHPLRVETHCNAGSLGTVRYGTALSVIYQAFEQGFIEKVWVDETRPVAQGARLTTWELGQAGVPYTLICDDMAGTIMRQGLVDAVIVGADRICANGDFANKIGTYGLAVLAKAHDVPFYVAAPQSTFDRSLDDGSQIVIEQRSPQEVRCVPSGREWPLVAPRGCDAYNPAFDVTPHELVTGYITELS